MGRKLVEESKRLSWLLRHGAGGEGLAMDAAGWVSVPDVLARVGLTRAALEEVVELNEKGRLELSGDGERVRACQGHSLAGMPVTREALEASWTPLQGDAPIWHGTNLEAAAGIARLGILPGARTHVHLAAALDSVVGKRASVHVMLEVAPARVRAAGLGLWLSGNGVVLARQIPASCISGLRVMTRAARADEARLRGLFPG